MAHINHLSDRAREIFDYHVNEDTPAGRASEIITILEAMDRLNQIREQLDKEGLFVESKRSGLTHVNPLIKVEHEQRKWLMKEWRRLALHRTNPLFQKMTA